MCLGIPAKVLKIEGDIAEVEVSGVVRKAGLHILPDAKVGNWVILHAGLAIQILNEEEAQETLELLEQV